MDYHKLCRVVADTLIDMEADGWPPDPELKATMPKKKRSRKKRGDGGDARQDRGQGDDNGRTQPPAAMPPAEAVDPLELLKDLGIGDDDCACLAARARQDLAETPGGLLVTGKALAQLAAELPGLYWCVVDLLDRLCFLRRIAAAEEFARQLERFAGAVGEIVACYSGERVKAHNAAAVYLGRELSAEGRLALQETYEAQQQKKRGAAKRP